MGYQQIGNSTVCKDTPQNRREFEAYCKEISRPGKKNDLLWRRIAAENKELRKMSCFLPGYEPDR